MAADGDARKTFVVDGLWSTVGSMNFDNRSLTLNDESTLMILDADTGARMNAIFFDDLRNSIEITPESFRQRPWTDHLGEYEQAWSRGSSESEGG
jgi:cardiolipin synthase